MTPRLPLLLTSLVLTLSVPALAQIERADDEGAQEPEARRLASGTTVMVIDRALETSLVRVTSIDGATIVGEDVRGQPVLYPEGDLVAFVRVTPRADVGVGVGAHELGDGQEWSIDRLQTRARAASAGVLVTTDGRRYPGDLAAWEGARSSAESTDRNASEGDGLLWETGGRPMAFALEDIAMIILEQAPVSVRLTLPDDATSDTLMLSNGDVVEGFVASVGGTVVLEREDGSMLELTPDRLHAMVLANPSTDQTGARVWFDDGTVIGDLDVFTDEGRWIGVSSMGRSGVRVWRPLSAARAMVFDATRLVPLSTLIATVSGPSPRPIDLRPHEDDALLDEAPTLGALDVMMGGPMRVRYDLPIGATRFACTLALEHPDSAWSDCEIAVLIDGEEIERVRLTGENPETALNIAFSDGASMEIVLDEGRYGPVRDGVRLVRPLLLVTD